MQINFKGRKQLWILAFSAMLCGALAVSALAQNAPPSGGQGAPSASGQSGGPSGMQGGPPDINEILANPPIVTYDRPAANTTGKLTVTSKTFVDGKIPLVNTSYAKSISPEVSWSAGPAGTKSYLLIMEDATAGRDKKAVLHWLAFNISPSVRSLPEGLPKLPDGWTVGGDDHGGPAPKQGSSSGQQAGPGPQQGGSGGQQGGPAPQQAGSGAQQNGSGYHGPSAPSGAPAFHYKIQIFAMDFVFDLKAGATRDQVWAAMEGHVLAKGYVEATFQGPAKQQ